MAKRNHSKRTRTHRVRKHGGNLDDEEYKQAVTLINDHFENGNFKDPLPTVNHVVFFSDLIEMYKNNEDDELKKKIELLAPIYWDKLTPNDQNSSKESYNIINAARTARLNTVYNRVGGKSRKSRRHSTSKSKSKTRKSRK